MHDAVVRWAVAVTVAAVSVASAVSAQEPAKTLPTLLIKGEVVSVDTADPAATLLKVKDRYGFETPIYLAQETKIAQGDQALTPASLTPGTAVEVEYNFDINTAKRHAVLVKVSGPSSSASPATPQASTPVPVPTTPVAPPAVTPVPAPAPSAAAPAPAAPAQAPATTQEHPGQTVQ